MSEVNVLLRMEESDAALLHSGDPCRVVVVNPESGAEGDDLPAKVHRVGSLPDPAEVVEEPRPRRCPRCDSPSPERHPAVQFEGEVQICPHPWHTTT